MAFELARLIGPPERELIRGALATDYVKLDGGRARSGMNEWEDHLERQIVEAKDISETDRESLVKARRGQSRFRERVLAIEASCRVIKVDRREHLIASHCTPWRDCTDAEERIDGENGLMLIPTIDHLFDGSFITFENAGALIVSPSADKLSLTRMGIDVDRGMNVGVFSEGQWRYLKLHRAQVFLESRVG